MCLFILACGNRYFWAIGVSVLENAWEDLEGHSLDSGEYGMKQLFLGWRWPSGTELQLIILMITSSPSDSPGKAALEGAISAHQL